MARRRGWQRQHITAIVAVNALGQATKPALLWNTKKIRGDMFLRAQCPVTLKGTPDGWASQEVFLEWVETVLVKEAQPLSNPQKCILLLPDGSKTHLTLQGLQKMKSWGVEVVVFPPQSDRCHPATRQSRFQGTKGLVSQKGRTLEKEKTITEPRPLQTLWNCGQMHMLMQSHHEIFCQALGPVASVRLIPNIFWNTVPVSASSTRTSLHALQPRCIATSSKKLFVRLVAKLFSISQVSSKSDASTQCSGRAIRASTRDDPWSLRLGGFVTAQDFLDKVNEKENGAAAKPAPKRRARRVGEPLRRVDRPAAKRPAKPAPKPGPEKRRRVDDPAPAPAPGLDEAQSSSGKGDGAGDPFDLYVSYRSSC